MFVRDLLLVGSLVSLVSAAPAAPAALIGRATGETVYKSGVAVYSVNDNDGAGAGTDRYIQYNGDGSTGAGWPSVSQWVSFEEMWNANAQAMTATCSQFGQANNSPSEIQAIRNAIEQIAAQTYVDHRFILAVIMQESGGCVRVPSTFGSVSNPGLMQDHAGTGTCNSNGNVQNPCPDWEITQMIQDGTAGTASGDGLANCLNNAPGSSAQAFYQAARIYNSGSIDPSGNLGLGVATHCYASDVANRLTGWVRAAHGCNL